ncbi:cell death-inducing p53-target protein 1-like [Hippocampus comes]|uniref:cell death-inducing p53-target protein 1-like n=1 Tax=Hippocampus comes TaxID=109280 RepID=UPI00094E7296|nr:PREDICTED: cell death-inducing p53-target protein 1-like [Hippocampus comes]
MATDVKHPPPFTIPVDAPAPYSLHTPFHLVATETITPVVPVSKTTVTSYNTALGFHSGMTTCPSCQQQVMTNVSYKPGKYAWLMTLLFFCLGLVLCCCLLPLFFKRFKDAHHTCPRCNRLLHVEKRKCCD